MENLCNFMMPFALHMIYTTYSTEWVDFFLFTTHRHFTTLYRYREVNPMDPNPAISAHAVFPQSSHIGKEKRRFKKKNPHFSKLEPTKN